MFGFLSPLSWAGLRQMSPPSGPGSAQGLVSLVKQEHFLVTATMCQLLGVEAWGCEVTGLMGLETMLICNSTQ